jgi:hypothetical protein
MSGASLQQTPTIPPSRCARQPCPPPERGGAARNQSNGSCSCGVGLGSGRGGAAAASIMGR